MPAGFKNPATLVRGFRNPALLVIGFRDSVASVNGFRNLAIGRFKSPATLKHGFRMPVGFRNPATYNSNLFLTTANDWDT